MFRKLPDSRYWAIIKMNLNKFKVEFFFQDYEVKLPKTRSFGSKAAAEPY